MIRRGVASLVRMLRLKRDPVGFARSLGVQIGDRCRLINTTVGTFGSEPYLIRLGDHVTITSGVQFITHDGGIWVFRDDDPTLDVIAPIVVGSNVFIGFRSIIMPGVVIGSDCVIGAGSIVTRDVPPGSVAVGVPARVVGTIDAYRRKIAGVGLPIHELAPKQKERVLRERFGGGASVA